MPALVNTPSAWLLLPFLLLLGAIALAPMVSARLWERLYLPVSIGLAAITVGFYCFRPGAQERLLSLGHEYLTFVIFLGVLFVVTGGIHIEVPEKATPLQNTALLLIGGVIANIFGTTGASMLLIRPWLRSNKERVAGYHIAFFIFIVSNIGGSVSSVADPPLLLGHLEGVPFWWITLNAWPVWLVAMAWLLAVFYFVDRWSYRRAVVAPSDPVNGSDRSERWGVTGSVNLLYALLAVAAMFIPGPGLLREAALVCLGAASWLTTPRRIRAANQFTLKPMLEVAILFLGIFGTMLPALDWLKAHASQGGSLTPGQLFWSCGLVSSVLDNAPAYLSFVTGTRAAFAGAGPILALPSLLADPRFIHCLLAVSIAAVFFGAGTYIGNAPNLLVKAVAEREQVRPPSFLNFILRYALPCLGPLFLLLWLLFFRGRD